jgi:Uma2 family endonuclease
MKLYGRRGVDEYWIVSWERRLVERYVREGAAMRLVATLREADQLTSPLLPGFSVAVSALFLPENA